MEAKIKQTLYDRNGKFVGEFDHIEVENGWLKVTVDGRWGVYTLDGEQVLPVEALKVECFVDHFQVYYEKLLKVETPQKSNTKAVA